MNHEHDEYTDELLYKRPSIPTDEILSILFGYSREELGKAERWTPEGIAEAKRIVEKDKKAVERAKKAMVIHFGFDPPYYPPPVVSPTTTPARKPLTKK